MAEVADDAYTARQASLDTLSSQAQDMRTSVAELQAMVAAEFPEGAPGAVRAAYDADGVLESLTIDEAAHMNPDELHDAFAIAFAQAPVPRPVLASLIADPARLAAIRAKGHVEPTPFSDEAGVVTLLCRQARPVRVRLGNSALARASYADIAAEVVRLARLAATEEAMS